MAVFKCKMCGGDIELNDELSVAQCEYCGTKQTLPKVNDEVMQNLFNRANNLRLKCEFDKAEQVYEKILNEDDTNAEAHWGMVLCKYGIEYVEDTKTYKRVPTCHRTSYEAVTADADYLAAIKYADVVQKSIYEEEAKAIDEIQKNILSIVRDEKPFDVFICYKETDETGKRTADSVIANDIYYQLAQERFKVFYAAITLEDKLGQEYEPYIFAALNSAKVMLVIGTKPHFFTSVWVKNEWSRFMKLMKKDRSKLLIPCYRDMDAYDLPEEFSHLQAQDMSKIGFINDVVRGIRKVVVNDEPKALDNSAKETVAILNSGATVDSLLKRMFLFLEDGDLKSANEYAEKILDIDPENSQAYFGKLLAEYKCRNVDRLVSGFDFSNSVNYKKALRFADDNYREYLEECLNKSIYNIAQRCEQDSKYLQALSCYERILDYNDSKSRCEWCLEAQYIYALKLKEEAKLEKDCKEAKSEFDKIKEYKDSEEQATECIEMAKCFRYTAIVKQMNLACTPQQFDIVADNFDTIKSYKDSAVLAKECRNLACKCKSYNDASDLYRCKSNNYYTRRDDLKSALELFEVARDFKDAKEKAEKCKNELAEINKIIDDEKAKATAYKKYLEKYSILADKDITLTEIAKLEKYLSRAIAKKSSKVLIIFVLLTIIGLVIIGAGIVCKIIEIIAIGIVLAVAFAVVCIVKIAMYAKRRKTILTRQHRLDELNKKLKAIEAVPVFNFEDFK